MKKSIIAMLAGLLICTAINAQTKDVKGTVTNDKNEPITGASIKVKNSDLASFTDDNGVFVINGITDTSVLVISAAGYQNAEVKVTDKSSISVILTKASSTADKVVLYRRDYMCLNKKNNCRFITGNFKIGKEIFL